MSTQLTPKGGLGNLFLDANKKPKILTICIVAAVLLIGFVYAVIKSASKPQSPSFLDYDYNVPKKQEPQKVTIAQDQDYVSKDEINNIIDQKLKNLSDQESITTDKNSSELIAAFNAAHQKDMDDLQVKNDVRFDQMQSEIADLKSLLKSGRSSSDQSGNYVEPFPGNQTDTSGTSGVVLPANDFSDSSSTTTNVGNSAIIIDNFTSRNDPTVIETPKNQNQD